MQRSLLLFVILLFTLTLSIYFGRMNLNVTEKLTTYEQNLLNAALAAAGNAKTTTPPSGNTKAGGIGGGNTSPPPKDFYKYFEKDSYDYDWKGKYNKNPLSDYYNWLEYWNNVSDSGDYGDYIAKTAIIPPVCPQCSSSGAGICTNCGGNGGSGTTSHYKNRFSDFLATYGSGYKGNGTWAGFAGRGPTLGQVADDTVKGTVDVAKTVVNDATGLAAGAGLGAIGLAAGAKDLLEDAGSGTVGLLKDTASGTKDLLKDAGSGAASLLKSNPIKLNNPSATSASASNSSGQTNNPYQSGYYSQGTYNLPNNPLGIQGIDPYSYNGALVSKGSNFIPVTNDFSNFRK
jgi:hypothetical protein